MKLFVKLLMAALMILMIAGCEKDENPVDKKSGKADVKKYVAIGNSLTAGFQSNGLYRSAQKYGYVKLISDQLTAAGAEIGTFEIPWWEDPGSPGADGKSARLVLRSLTGPVIVPEGLAPGAQSNLQLTRPYDNLGIPGAILYDFLDTTNFVAKSQSRANPFFAHVLRSSNFGNSVLAQAKNLNPDLITFWLGNNDVLGYATSGGTSENMVGSVGPTPTAIFTQLINGAIGALKASFPNAKIAVANIPDVKSVPYFTTIGPKVAASIPAGMYVRYQKHGVTGGSFDSTTFTEAGAPFLTLPASGYVTELGVASGKWYRDNRYAQLPAGIDTSKPFGFHPLNPIPDKLVLDASEQAVAQTSVTEFNAAIAATASANGAALVDINTFFTGVKANGITIGGVKYTADFITGQLFSLDGVHPSSKGQGIIANEFIKVMNAKFFNGAVEPVDVSSLPGISVTPLAKYGYQEKHVAQMSYPEWQSFIDLWK